MKIAVFSDIHDNLAKLRSALAKLKETEALLFCGDLCSPFVVKELSQGFNGPIHIVFGNNDGDLYRITEAARRFPNITLHGELGEIELAGKRIAMIHFDNIGQMLADSGRFDMVCFGHNHRFNISNKGDSLVINPGEIFGCLTGNSTFALYDTASGKAERVDV